MENEEYFLDDTDFIDYTDSEFQDESEEEVVERAASALDYQDFRPTNLPFEHEIRQIDDF